jgi:hypothetical protein
VLEAGRRARDPARGAADVEELLGVAEVDPDGVQRRALARRGRADEEVEDRRLDARPGDQEVAPGARAVEQRLAGPGGQARGDRRVDGVAAGAQDGRPRLGGGRVAGGDDALHAAHPRSAGPVGPDPAPRGPGG